MAVSKDLQSYLLLFFLFSSLLLLGNCALAFVMRDSGRRLLRLSSFFTILAGIVGISYSLVILGFGFSVTMQVPFGVLKDATLIPSASYLSFRIDALSAFFLAIIYFVSSAGALYSSSYLSHYLDGERHVGSGRIPVLVSLYSLFVLAMVGVAVADHAVSFILAWELMSLFSFFLVMTEHENPKTRSAGFTYLIMTHFGTAFILFFLGFMYSVTGSLDFREIAASPGIAALSDNVRTALFVALLIGFGTKAGMVPLHIWLPLAHPQAPSHVSALMSGVMVKIALLMFARFAFTFLGALPVACGVITLVAGAVTSMLGILYAVVESDLKKSLAYSTIENVGIMLAALGCSFTLLSAGAPYYAAFAFSAMLYHVLAHSIFKSLLFMNAGAVISAAHTGDMDEMGGIIRKMPQTAFFFLVGAMSMAALPPSAGFVSEWMIFQSVLLTLKSPGTWAKIIVPIVGAAIALASALAAFNAVRSMFSVFLARHRGHHKYLIMHEMSEAPFSMRAAMIILTVAAFAFGIFATLAMPALRPAAGALIPAALDAPDFFAGTRSLIFPVHQALASFSPLLVFSALISLFFLAWFSVNFLYAKRGYRVYETWSCGGDLDETMEYTPESYSQPLMVVFKNVYRPTTSIETVHNEDRYILKRVTFRQSTTPFFETYLYKPMTRFLYILSNYMKRMQVGYIHVYLLYIFVTLIVLLFAVR